jgi:hypothetical protein
MSTLFLIVAILIQASTTAIEVTPTHAAQDLVTPVLDLLAESKSAKGDRQQEMFFQAKKLLGQVIQSNAKASDEALAVLMRFYVGEATGSDLLHAVTTRGKRMLPLLSKYRNARVVFSRRKYPASLLLAPDVTEEDFNEAIKNIKTGTVVGED